MAIGANTTGASFDGASSVAVDASLSTAGAAFDCRDVEWLVDGGGEAGVGICGGGGAMVFE